MLVVSFSPEPRTQSLYLQPSGPKLYIPEIRIWIDQAVWMSIELSQSSTKKNVLQMHHWSRRPPAKYQAKMRSISGVTPHHHHPQWVILSVSLTGWKCYTQFNNNSISWEKAVSIFSIHIWSQIYRHINSFTSAATLQGWIWFLTWSHPRLWFEYLLFFTEDRNLIFFDDGMTPYSYPPLRAVRAHMISRFARKLFSSPFHCYPFILV